MIFSSCAISALYFSLNLFSYLTLLELMGPTGPNSSSCRGPAVWRTQGLALLAYHLHIRIIILVGFFILCSQIMCNIIIHNLIFMSYMSLLMIFKKNNTVMFYWVKWVIFHIYCIIVHNSFERQQSSSRSVLELASLKS